jgi:murein DD-endopeptidase MepM/ murein hydrolase activator NlpD
MIKKLKKNWKKIKKITREIHKVSDALHFPIFDKKVISRLFGIQIAGLAAALSFVAYPTQAFDYNLSQSIQSEILVPVVMTTNSQFTFPLESTLGMSQGYGGFHPGVDLRAPKGTPVYAMAEGTVIEVEKVAFGYGHSVRIAHKGTTSTLYAHLDKVEVKSGEKVERGEEVGTVGMTGRTTGPHLHFEVYVGDRSVNPMTYIASEK